MEADNVSDDEQTYRSDESILSPSTSLEVTILNGMQSISLQSLHPNSGTSSGSSTCSNPDEVTESGDSSARRTREDRREFRPTLEDRRATEAERRPIDAPEAISRSSAPEVDSGAVEVAESEGFPTEWDTGGPRLLAETPDEVTQWEGAERQRSQAPAAAGHCSTADQDMLTSAAEVVAGNEDGPAGQDGQTAGGGAASEEAASEEERGQHLELEGPPPGAAAAAETALTAPEAAVSRAEREGAAEAEGEEEDDDEEDDDDDDGFDWGAAKHIFVLSSAGKPVFSLSGDEQQLSTLMGLIQALLSLCTDCDSGDELESISAGGRRFVFLKRGNLVLVAVSSSSRPLSSSDIDSDGDGEGDAGEEEEEKEEEGGEEPECESFMRLQLEYLYASILFLLTSKFQGMFTRTPGYDLRGLLDGADTSLRGVVQLAEPSRGRGRMLAGGVETVWMDPTIRSRVAKALLSAQAASATSGALYAIWLCGEKLVSMAQPRAPSHRLTSRDLLLLVNFVATQPALRNGESWTPVCFPRFQETGYLYAYVAFLEDPSVATPPPAPPEATAEQQPAPAGDTREGGGVDRPSNDNGAQTRAGGNSATDGISRAKGENGGAAGADGASCVVLVSVDSSSEQFQAFRRTRSALESRFRSALGTHWDRYLGSGAAVEREGILAKFCSQMKALHFYYCLRGKQGGAPCVTQCLSSPFVHPELATDPAAQHRVWGYYTRAALRLRRGSSQEGRVFCRREGGEAGNSGGMRGGGNIAASGDRGKSKTEPDFATALFESDPEHSLAYEIGENVTVMSLFGQREGGGRGGGGGGGGGGRWTSSYASNGAGRWGERDELHACFPSSVPPEAAYKAAVRLTAIVRRDREWLFLTGTGAAK